MKNKITLEVFGDTFECEDFFEIVGTSTEVSGVEIFRDGERLGSMIGLSVPDKTDFESVEHFTKELETWLIDND